MTNQFIHSVDSGCFSFEQQTSQQQPRPNDGPAADPVAGDAVTAATVGFRSQINANSSGKYDEIKSSGSRCANCHTAYVDCTRQINAVLIDTAISDIDRTTTKFVIFGAALVCVLRAHMRYHAG